MPSSGNAFTPAIPTFSLKDAGQHQVDLVHGAVQADRGPHHQPDRRLQEGPQAALAQADQDQECPAPSGPPLPRGSGPRSRPRPASELQGQREERHRQDRDVQKEDVVELGAEHVAIARHTPAAVALNSISPRCYFRLAISETAEITERCFLGCPSGSAAGTLP
jgi:hypothetical protein